MIFFFVSKVSTRPSYFEGQNQGQGHAKVTSDLEAKKSLKVIFHRNSTKFELHLPSDLRCITLKFLVTQGDNDGTL